MPDRFFIIAANIHQGGGLTLLLELLHSVKNKADTIVLLDNRARIPDNFKNYQFKFIAPTLFQRLKTEYWLYQNVKKNDVVLCFGNLPPIFQLKGQTVVFIQNRFLIDDVDLKDLHMKTRLRIRLERYWLKNRSANLDEIIVQTPSMKTLIEKQTKGTVPVRKLPFISMRNLKDKTVPSREKLNKNAASFVYVASGEGHKNHKKLIRAWGLLAKENIKPKLFLTIDKYEFPDLCSWIDKETALNNLNIINLGCLPLQKIKQLYTEVDALIYPSLFESFGLPLLEAQQYKLPILASELDYVRDLLDPDQTFNPKSYISIAKAVKRYLLIDEEALHINSGDEFIEAIISRKKTQER